MEWKVPSHGMPSTAWPTIWPMRSFISRAALLVKVTERISFGRARPVASMCAIRACEHARLAGAGAGEHQHRAVERFHGFALLGVEPVEIARAVAARARAAMPPAVGWWSGTLRGLNLLGSVIELVAPTMALQAGQGEPS